MRLRFGVMPAPISAVRRTSVATWRPLERGQGERITLLGMLTDKPSIVLATVARYRRRNGVGRVRISRFLFTVFHTQYRPGSGGGTYLTVYQRPQVQAGTVNSALQCAYRAAGRASGFFVTLLFYSDHTKGFFLFPRQALEGDVKLAQFGPVVLRSRDSHLRHLVEITVLAPASHAGNEVIGHYPVHPGREIRAGDERLARCKRLHSDILHQVLRRRTVSGEGHRPYPHFR